VGQSRGWRGGRLRKLDCRAGCAAETRGQEPTARLPGGHGFGSVRPSRGRLTTMMARQRKAAGLLRRRSGVPRPAVAVSARRVRAAVVPGAASAFCLARRGVPSRHHAEEASEARLRISARMAKPGRVARCCGSQAYRAPDGTIGLARRSREPRPAVAVPARRVPAGRLPAPRARFTAARRDVPSRDHVGEGDAGGDKLGRLSSVRHSGPLAARRDGPSHDHARRPGRRWRNAFLQFPSAGRQSEYNRVFTT